MPIVKLVESFRAAAIAKGDFEGARQDADLHRAMVHAHAGLMVHGPEGRAAFRQLLRDASPFVRTWVAAQLIAEGDDSATAVLEDLAGLPGAIGFSAQMTLREHRAGRLRPWGRHGV